METNGSPSIYVTSNLHLRDNRHPNQIASFALSCSALDPRGCTPVRNFTMSRVVFLLLPHNTCTQHTPASQKYNFKKHSRMAQQPPLASPSRSDDSTSGVRSINTSVAGSVSDNEYDFASLSDSPNGSVHNKASNTFMKSAYPHSERSISTANNTAARAAKRLMMETENQANTIAKLKAQATTTNSSEYSHLKAGVRSD